jgi:hypothetical protein
MAVAVAAELARTAHQLAEAEAVRDAARRPFLEQTERAQRYAKQVADYPALAERIRSLLRTDVVITKLGESAYSRVPRPQGSHVGYVRTFYVPRTVATEETLRATKLPGFWPVRGNDFSFLDGPNCALDEGESITSALHQLSEKADQRRIVLSEGDVDRAIAQAQASVLAEFHKAVGALRELLRRDAGVSSADRDARYPDGAPIFDPVQFPDGWQPGLMSRRIALPATDGLAMAAE